MPSVKHVPCPAGGQTGSSGARTGESLSATLGSAPLALWLWVNYPPSLCQVLPSESGAPWRSCVGCPPGCSTCTGAPAPPPVRQACDCTCGPQPRPQPPLTSPQAVGGHTAMSLTGPLLPLYTLDFAPGQEGLSPPPSVGRPSLPDVLLPFPPLSPVVVPHGLQEKKLRLDFPVADRSQARVGPSRLVS